MQSEPFYTYHCAQCDVPHKHRSENKYPELCKPCAIRKAQRERRIRERRIGKWKKFKAALRRILTFFIRELNLWDEDE